MKTMLIRFSALVLLSILLAGLTAGPSTAGEEIPSEPSMSAEDGRLESGLGDRL